MKAIVYNNPLTTRIVVMQQFEQNASCVELTSERVKLKYKHENISKPMAVPWSEQLIYQVRGVENLNLRFDGMSSIKDAF